MRFPIGKNSCGLQKRQATKEPKESSVMRDARDENKTKKES